MKKLALLSVARSTLSALTAGCNTMRALGQDIEKGGEAIQRGATK